jgi:hypothetical protein
MRNSSLFSITSKLRSRLGRGVSYVFHLVPGNSARPAPGMNSGGIAPKSAMTTPSRILSGGLVAAAIAASSLAADGVPALPASAQKPDWLSDASIGVKESYDDNVLLVSGDGLQPVSSWVNDVALKLGINFVPLLGDQHALQTLSLVYQPDFVTYDKASSENYDAHRFITSLKGKSDNLSFSFDNTFLYNDGSRVAPTYALNQLAGAAANQNDKYRNNFAHGIARERRNQTQDRYTAFLQYNTGSLFVRPVSALTFYDLNTVLHNTGAAPYKGYQDYVDRYDINGGADLGFKVTPSLWATLGYRYGYQYQQQFALAINSDQHFSSGHYQRALAGLEGKVGILTLKLAAGPQFQDYGGATPINNPHTTRYYAEATVSAAIAPDQSLNFNYKQWLFVASTGLAPYVDSSYTLNYHWNATKQLGFDLGAKFLEANYTLGNDVAGSAPARRDDLDYGLVAGASYAFNPHFSASVAYNYDLGRNGDHNLPANLFASYRDFEHNVVTVGLTYKF